MWKSSMDVFSRPLVALHRPALIVRVGVALVSLVVALGLSLLFRLYFGSGTFLLFFGAVAIIAAYSGLPIALASVLISLALINYFLFPPFQAWTATPDVFARGVIFVFVACLISWLSETRRQATAQAYVQAERFFVTLSSIGDGVIVTDAARRITFLNPVAESLTGWSQSEAEGKDIADVFDIIDAETRQPVEHPVAHVLRDGTVVGLANHTLLRAKGGAERPIDDSGAPISDVSGHLIGVVVVFRDITARAESERERARLLAQEQSARTQLTTLLERITDGVAAFDPEWRYSYVNAQAAQLLRKTPEQLLGQRLGERRLGHCLSELAE
jgi:PAS domain S-box-containing protein